MWSLSSVAAFGMAVMLAWAAFEKARNLAGVSEIVRQLGSPGWLSRPASLLLVMTEIGAASGLLYDWSAVWTRTAVAALAVTFAAAGAWALWNGKSLRCDCFGLGSGTALGMKQIVVLPLWFLGIGLLSLTPHAPSFDHVAVQLAALGLCLVLLRMPALLQARWEASGDRHSARETYTWLP